MLKRLAAALLLVGLALPYGSGVRPLTGAWDGVEPSLMIGIPLLITIAYALHTFLPPLARFHERNGPALHGVFRVVYSFSPACTCTTGSTEEATAGSSGWRRSS